MMAGSDISTDDSCAHGQNQAALIQTLSDEDDRKYYRRRFIRTCCMAPFYLCLGLYSGIISTTIPDLEEHFNCNVAQLSVGLMPKAIGILSGSIGGALISDRFRKHSNLCLFCVSCTAGLLNAALPWGPNLPLFGTWLFLQGLCHGTTNVVCSSVTMGEWKDKSKLPVNYLHLFHSMGMLVAPLSTAPFLSPNVNATHHNASTGPSLDWMESNSHIPPENSHNGSSDRNSQLYIPFTMHGAVGVAASLVFLWFYFSGWEYRSAATTSTNTGGSTGRCSLPSKFIGFAYIAALFIYVSMITRDKSLGTFNFTIAVTALKITKNRAAMYNTVYNASWVVGRAGGTILVKFIRVHWIVFVGTAFALVTNVMIYLYAMESELLFWVLTCLIGLWCGPCYACIMTWFNEYIPAGGTLVATIDIGIGAGAFMASWLGGYILHTIGPSAIFLQSLAGTVGVALITLPLQVVFSLHGTRFEEIEKHVSVPEHSDESDTVDESSPLIQNEHVVRT